jgi:putative DNA primase/helicase
MDARTPDPQFVLPMALPNEVPRHLDSELWRIANRTVLSGRITPGREVGIADFEHLARMAFSYGKARPRQVQRGDVTGWLQSFAEAHNLPERLGTETVTFALETTAEEVFHEDDPGDPQLPEFSDDALALTFADRHKDDLRYVSEWGQWRRWNGRCWHKDNTLRVWESAREICREVAASIVDGWAIKKALLSYKTIAAVERLARSDSKLAATIDQWDSDPWKLNTPGAVVDLCTGASMPPSAHDYMTKVTAVAPEGDCPIWENFLARITERKPELVEFLQRVAGYSLTGVTTEQALFFAYGTGGNGKGVFINTIAKILGAYHETAAMETFTASKNDHHPTDTAGLHGARLVTAAETEKGWHWNETKIKTLTGGDPIRTRFMHKDYFQYTPQFKLLISGNHKPSLSSVDEAIRRRFHLIPFVVTIPPEERDLELADKLKAEWPGILAWMIKGCLHWRRDGLRPPAAVIEATNEYLNAEDSLANWLADQCELDPRSFTSVRALFASWKSWTERSGEATGSKKAFSENLKAKGFHKDKLSKNLGGRGYWGIKVVDYGEN